MAWQVSLNLDKCKIMSEHHRRYSNKGVSPNYVKNNTPLEEVTDIKDLRCLLWFTFRIGQTYFWI